MLSPQTAGQSPRQFPEFSFALQMPSPHDGEQSPGQFPAFSPGLHMVSPQAGAQSPGQLPEFSFPVQRPSPQPGGQSPGQLAAFSDPVQNPSPQVVGQSPGQFEAFSFPLQMPSPQTGGQSPGQLEEFSFPLQMPSPQVAGIVYTTSNSGRRDGVLEVREANIASSSNPGSNRSAKITNPLFGNELSTQFSTILSTRVSIQPGEIEGVVNRINRVNPEWLFQVTLFSFHESCNMSIFAVPAYTSTVQNSLRVALEIVALLGMLLKENCM